MYVASEAPLPRAERSAAVDLTWLLCTCDLWASDAEQPCPAERVPLDPELRGAARAFWGAGTAHGAELLVLAAQAGALFEPEFDPLLEVLSRRQPDPGELRLASESPEERAAVLARLARLRRSAALRRSYVALLRRLVEAAHSELSGGGALAANRAVDFHRERLAGGTSWRELVANPVADAIFPALLERLPRETPVVLVPSPFFGKFLVVDLGELLVVGAGVTAAPPSLERHASLARRLRAVGHPTRLGIISSLSTHAASVGELAAEFSVAQPTVTNHVKLLREAGLVRSERQGTRLTLHVDEAALAELVGAIGSLTAPRDATAGGARTRAAP